VVVKELGSALFRRAAFSFPISLALPIQEAQPQLVRTHGLASRAGLAQKAFALSVTRPPVANVVTALTQRQPGPPGCSRVAEVAPAVAIRGSHAESLAGFSLTEQFVEPVQ